MAPIVTLTEQALTDGTKQLKLTSPYEPTLPPKARALGGRWHPETKTWRFDPRDVERVRSMCLGTFGVDPLAEPDEGVEIVTVRIDLDKVGDTNELWLFGRCIATRPSRDYRVKLGDGVVLIAGGFPSSGGSAKYPALRAQTGTVLEVRDVPAMKVQADQQRIPGLVLTIVEAERPDAVRTTTAQIGVLFETLPSESKRAVLMSMLGSIPAGQRGAVADEMRLYLEQGAV